MHPADGLSSEHGLVGAAGIGLVLFTSAVSGLGGVFNEWLIKYQDPEAPLMFKNLMIYLVGSLMCFWSWKPRAPIGDPLVFGILVGVQAAAGLCVSLVLKYCDNVIKGFSTSAAVLLATLCAAAFFGFVLHGPFAAGVLIVSLAFYLYFVQPSVK